MPALPCRGVPSLGGISFMKTCSKCKRSLDESCFVKSDRYLDGLYPSCKECRKKVRDQRVARQVLCFRCNAVPRMKSTIYCSPCLKWFQSGESKNKPCARCLERVRRKCSDFCSICAKEIELEWRRVRCKEYRDDPENKVKNLARQMLNYHVNSGRIERMPCAVCGHPKTEGHHHNGYDREHWLDVVWLCMVHHVQVEKELRQRLTIPST